MIEKSKKLLTVIQKNSQILKGLFLFSVLLFVVNQMTGILQGMTWHQLGEILFSQRKRHLLVMIVTGLVAVLPMITYDWVTIGILEDSGKPKMPRKYLFTSAWATNTINNLAGFGGVIGATLRARFYGREVAPKKTLATVSKVAFFMLTGLSFLCLIAMVDIYFIRDSHPFRNYWVWLFGGSLVAPSIIGFILYKRQAYFQEFTNRRIAQLFLGSIGQWSGALGTFLMIGYLLKVEVSLMTVYPLFIAATFIGMISMVPGGMGTFDVLMIVGLGSVGVSKELAVGWLLFYRIFYYLVPFLTGLYSLVHQLGAKTNEYLNGIPKKISQRLAHVTLVTMVYFAGLLMILLSTIPNLSTLNQMFQKLLPLSFNFLDQKLNMLVGFLLLGLARGVSQRVKKAYLPTMAVLVFAIVNTIAHTVSWQLLIFYGVLLGVLFWSRKEFYRKQLVFTPETIIIDGLLYGSLLILYSIVGYYASDRVTHGVAPSRFLLFPSEGVWLEGVVGLLLAALTISLLYHYLTGNAPIGENFQKDRLAHLITGEKLLMPNTLPGDALPRQYYYQHNGKDKVVIHFTKKGSQLAVEGNPLGSLIHLRGAVQEFLQEADELGYQVLFYGVTAEVTLILHDFGFNFMKVGELAYLTKGREPLKEAPLAYHVTEASDPQCQAMISLINQSNHHWECQGRDGMPLSLSVFSDLLAQGTVSMAQTNQGEIIGLICHQFEEQGTATYQALAYLGTAPAVKVKEALLQHSASLSYQKGERNYLLGFMPLRHVGGNNGAFSKEQVLHLVYQYSSPMETLRQEGRFKEGMATVVESRYVSYQKNVHSVFLVAQLCVAIVSPFSSKFGILKKFLV